jgi:hypothetical protein
MRPPESIETHLHTKELISPVWPVLKATRMFSLTGAENLKSKKEISNPCPKARALGGREFAQLCLAI